MQNLLDLQLFELFYMLYVDDGAFVFKSRHQLEIGIPLLLRHFAKFGLEMHIGKENKPSKTECVFFPTPGYFNFPTLPNSDASTIFPLMFLFLVFLFNFVS